MGDFLLVISELFLLGAFVLSQYTHLTDGWTDRRTDRQNLDSNTVRMLCSRTEKTERQQFCYLRYVRWPYNKSSDLHHNDNSSVVCAHQLVSSHRCDID